LKKAISILTCIIILTGCELIVIGSKKEKPIDIDQASPLGAVYLFKTELDSNNVPAATRILASPNGGMYLALEKYEMYDEIARIGRIIGQKPITQVNTDSLTNTSYRIHLEVDYLKYFSFTTSLIRDNWYITNYTEQYN